MVDGYTKINATFKLPDGTNHIDGTPLPTEIPITLSKTPTGLHFNVQDLIGIKIPGTEFTTTEGKKDWKKFNVNPIEPTMRSVEFLTSVSDVRGNKGELDYRGYAIGELVEKAKYEEVIYTLLRGDLPNTKEQLSELKSKLAEAAVLDDDVQKELKNALNVKITEDTDAMALMNIVVSIMSAHQNHDMKMGTGKAEPEKERYETALKTTAIMPTLVGLVNAKLDGKLDEFTFAKKSDFEETEFSYAKLLLSALTRKPMRELNDETQIKTLDQYLTLHAEHGLNVGTLAAITAGSAETKAGGWRPTLAGMQALAGDLHGAASVDALQNLIAISKRPGGSAQEKVDAYFTEIEEKKAAKEAGTSKEDAKIPGVGHAVYTQLDPRAIAMKKLLNDIAASGTIKGPGKELIEIAVALEKKVEESKYFGKKEGGDKKPIHPNVDFYSGVLLNSYLGVNERLMTPMFAVARNIGWHAHVAEYKRDHGNTGTVLHRPEAFVPPNENNNMGQTRPVESMEERLPPTTVTGVRMEELFPVINSFVNNYAMAV